MSRKIIWIVWDYGLGRMWSIHPTKKNAIQQKQTLNKCRARKYKSVRQMLAYEGKRYEIQKWQSISGTYIEIFNKWRDENVSKLREPKETPETEKGSKE